MDKTKEYEFQKAGLSNRFWLKEEPEIYRTSDNCFRYYKTQNVLSVSTPDFPDRSTGLMRIGKTVTVQLTALIESPAALKALLEILCAARDKVNRDTWTALK